MRFYAVVDSTNMVNGLCSAGDDFKLNLKDGLVAYEITHAAYDAAKNRDRKRTQLIWDDDLEELWIEPADQETLLAVAWEELRAKRNQLLAATDKTAIPDFPNRDLYVDYRQALRDLPQNTVDPFNPVWPELQEGARLYLSGKATVRSVNSISRPIKEQIS
jgi:hypothetical protein